MLKLIVSKEKSGHMVTVKAGNGEVLMWSEKYASKQGAFDAVAVLQDKAFCAPVFDLTTDEEPNGYRFEIDDTKNDQFMARFRASNDEIMIWSETYTAKHNAKACADNIRNNIRDAEVIDATKSEAA